LAESAGGEGGNCFAAQKEDTDRSSSSPYKGCGRLGGGREKRKRLNTPSPEKEGGSNPSSDGGEKRESVIAFDGDRRGEPPSLRGKEKKNAITIARKTSKEGHVTGKGGRKERGRPRSLGPSIRKRGGSQLAQRPIRRPRKGEGGGNP